SEASQGAGKLPQLRTGVQLGGVDLLPPVCHLADVRADDLGAAFSLSALPSERELPAELRPAVSGSEQRDHCRRLQRPAPEPGREPGGRALGHGHRGLLAPVSRASAGALAHRGQRLRRVAAPTRGSGVLERPAGPVRRSTRCHRPTGASIPHLSVRDLPLPSTPAASGCMRRARPGVGRRPPPWPANGPGAAKVIRPPHWRAGTTFCATRVLTPCTANPAKTRALAKRSVPRPARPSWNCVSSI